uniref:Glycine radical domain-containing protein n=1 Tax=Glossina brevipalpis TaxID=37001 RepID=A0A1A9WEU1_9MUSC
MMITMAGYILTFFVYLKRQRQQNAATNTRHFVLFSSRKHEYDYDYECIPSALTVKTLTCVGIKIKDEARHDGLNKRQQIKFENKTKTHSEKNNDKENCNLNLAKCFARTRTKEKT